jgi:hypothetical protein
MRRRTRLATGAVMTLALVLTAGAAAAYWPGTASGRGAATTGSTATISLSAGVVTGDLYPGFSATVSTVATNQTTAEARIDSLALNTARGTGGFRITGDTPAGGCAAASFAFATQRVDWVLPAGGTSARTLPDSISMAKDASSACQGAEITVFLVAGT